jgi:hypothetical protein
MYSTVSILKIQENVSTFFPLDKKDRSHGEVTNTLKLRLVEEEDLWETNFINGCIPIFIAVTNRIPSVLINDRISSCGFIKIFIW